jgi:hypothetical protein
MITGVLAIAFAAIVLVMTTLGAVLIARLLMGRSTLSQRVMAAAVGGPATVIVPSMGIIVIDGGPTDSSALVGFAVAFVIAFGVIGWPVAHFATRRLDRLTQFDPQVFE